MTRLHSFPDIRVPVQPSIWSRLRVLLGDWSGSLGLLAIGSVLAGLTEAGILAVLAQVAAALVDGRSWADVDVGGVHIHATVGVLLAVSFGLALLRLALQALVSILPARIVSGVYARLSTEAFGAFTRASWTVQSRDREGYLQELVTNQVGQATGSVLQGTALVSSSLTFIVLVISAFVLNATAALTVLVAAVALFGLLRPLGILGDRRARAFSQAQIAYAGGINEAVRLAEESHVFDAGEAQRRQIDRLLVRVRDLFFYTQMLGRLVPGIYQSAIYLLIVVGFIALYATGAGHIVSLGAVLLLLIRAGTYGQQIQGGYQSFRQTLPYLERVQEAQCRYAMNGVAAGAQPFVRVRTLSFENVHFAYDNGRPVLSDITFAVADGEAIGIVGPSGAGKSTLVQILLRLRVPDHGRYLVNGEPAEQFVRKDWHRLIAYVSQEPRLLHASVADNIRFFRDLDDVAVQHAARLARIHDEIVKWSDGYDTIVGPRADAVSGGQQQRICLARALAARPQVLVLDEPTSALDPHSEFLIQESLTALKDELTLFVVAHRMSTLDMCERVMVIVDGRLEAFDTASQLLSDSVYYRSASALAMGTQSMSRSK